MIAEGYIVTLTGSGTFVTDRVQGQRPPIPKSALAGRRLTLSARGERLIASDPAITQEIQPFVPDLDDFSAFPVKIWQRLQNRHWREARSELFDYGAGGGYRVLARFGGA